MYKTVSWKRFVPLWAWGLKNFSKNLWRYKAWLWHDSDFDHGYLAEVMIIKLRAMAKHQREHQFVTTYEEIAAECDEAAQILEDRGKCDFDKEAYDRLTKQEQTDYWLNSHAHDAAQAARFGELMAKMEGWWD